MKCPICGSPLMVSSNKLTSDVGSTDVWSELTMVCINDKRDSKGNFVCDNYCGPDMTNPKVKVETIRNKAQ